MVTISNWRTISVAMSFEVTCLVLHLLAADLDALRSDLQVCESE